MKKLTFSKKNKRNINIKNKLFYNNELIGYVEENSIEFINSDKSELLKSILLDGNNIGISERKFGNITDDGKIIYDTEKDILYDIVGNFDKYNQKRYNIILDYAKKCNSIVEWKQKYNGEYIESMKNG